VIAFRSLGRAPQPQTVTMPQWRTGNSRPTSAYCKQKGLATLREEKLKKYAVLVPIRCRNWVWWPSFWDLFSGFLVNLEKLLARAGTCAIIELRLLLL